VKIWSSFITRRRFLSGCVALGAGAASWTRFFEPWWFKIAHHTVPLGLGGEPLRLLQLSDMHADPMPLDYLRKTFRAGLALKPDVICVTGDFITKQYDRWDEYAHVLAELPAVAPTFAILGNHDGGKWAHRPGYHEGYADTGLVRSMLDAARIPLLHNRHERLELRGRALDLVGVGDWWADEMDPASAFSGWKRERGVPAILLSHNPDTKDRLLPFSWDVMLSGHTHGGQLSLPFVGEPFAPIRDRRFVRGLHRWENRWLHITAGIGALHTARFNCRPEVSLLSLA
jgi:predicted MPP superfamily phosphohydrolase